MNYEEEDVLSDSEFDPKEDSDLDDGLLDEPLEEKDDFKFDEEESESL